MNRERLVKWLEWLALVALAVFGARLGLPPITVPPPPVNITVPPPVVPTDPPSPRPAPPAPVPSPDPLAAICRITLGSAGCTATVISPQRADGRWYLVSAAHCTTAVGQRGTATTRGGRSFGFRVVSRVPGADVAWLLSDDPLDNLPFAEIAQENPAVGDEVWHAGFGVDKPANTERGTVLALPNRDGQIEYRLSVSSGDSGGGIIHTRTGRLLSPVCCTTSPSRVGRVWGAGPEAIAAAAPADRVGHDWVPVPIPTRPDPEPVAPAP